VCLHEIIAQGHLKEGLIRKGASAQTQIFPKCEGKVAGTIRPTPGSRKGLRLITEREHQGLRESLALELEILDQEVGLVPQLPKLETMDG
jgi:hypothetical protein